jgi:hypothetical protein
MIDNGDQIAMSVTAVAPRAPNTSDAASAIGQRRCRDCGRRQHVLDGGVEQHVHRHDDGGAADEGARQVAARVDVFAGEVAAALPAVVGADGELQRERHGDEVHRMEFGARQAGSGRGRSPQKCHDETAEGERLDQAHGFLQPAAGSRAEEQKQWRWRRSTPRQPAAGAVASPGSMMPMYSAAATATKATAAQLANQSADPATKPKSSPSARRANT